MDVIGHRGARGLFPENTVEGFRAALAMGVRAFELDVGVLKCGTVVVHHDVALNPDIAAMDGRWLAGSLPLLKDLTLGDLEDIEVGRLRPGSAVAAQFPEQRPIGGCGIPTLAQVLAVDPGAAWTIELKLVADRPDWTVGVAAMVERVLAVVDAAGGAGDVCVSSFDWRGPRLVRALRPGMGVSWLTRGETVADAGTWWGVEARGSVVEAVAAEGGGRWSPHWEGLTAEEVGAAHGLGLTVVPWTVNEPADMARLRGWGVDGVITDRPDLAPAP